MPSLGEFVALNIFERGELQCCVQYDISPAFRLTERIFYTTLTFLFLLIYEELQGGGVRLTAVFTPTPTLAAPVNQQQF